MEAGLLRRFAWLVLLVVQPVLAQTAEAQTVWRMTTEYPATAIPGQGVTTFAERLAATSGGRITIVPSYDASLGIKSAGMLDAVQSNTIEAGDAFAGALASVDPVFQLSSLPFLATSIADARRLTDLARPLYARVLALHGQRLLYTTPWPPSGIWSKRALAGPADLAALTIRTYDETSNRVMSAAGAGAVMISFADAMPKLRDGSVNAVLSSGDGGAGRRLWELLPHFTEISYVMPLSIATINASLYAALPDDLKRAVDTAARATDDAQWALIETRQAENYATMRRNGVTIAADPDLALLAPLKAGGVAITAEWERAAGPEAAALLARFRSGGR